MSRIRVCMLVRNDCRTDYRVLKEARSLAQAGFAVTIVAINTYGPWEHEERDGFRILRVPVERARTRVGKAINLLPRAIRRMALVAQQVAADIYHAHDSDAILPAWLATRQVPGAKLIYDAHEVGFLSLRENLALFPLPLALINWAWGLLNDWIVSHRVDDVIAVNKILADLQAEHYRIRSPTLVMNCPPRFIPTLSSSRNVLADLLGIDRTTPIVIYQGRLLRERHGKGLENLVRSAALLQRGVLVILGGGPFFEGLRDIAAHPPFEGRVFVLPTVPVNELLTYTYGASIGIIPTEVWHPSLRFSSPNKFFEYLAVGLPVVTSDLPIVRQICEQYGCGLTCDPSSPDSIAAAINRILGDEDLYATMRAGALRAAEVYNWENQERALIGLYERLLGDRLEARV